VDATGDPHDLLLDDATGADILMAHLAVAHHLVGQAHIMAASLDERVGIFSHEAIIHGRARQVDRVGVVPFRERIRAPSVTNDEDDRSLCLALNHGRYSLLSKGASLRDPRRIHPKFVFEFPQLYSKGVFERRISVQSKIERANEKGAARPHPTSAAMTRTTVRTVYLPTGFRLLRVTGYSPKQQSDPTPADTALAISSESTKAGSTTRTIPEVTEVALSVRIVL